MNFAATLMVCIAGQCFNPSQITYTENKDISGACVLYFHRQSYITIEGKNCEEVSHIINKEIAKQQPAK